MVDAPGSLPAGWTTEIKTHKSGPKAGTQYKCYIDPLTGKKFYSKKGVLRFLGNRKCDNRKSEPKEKAANTPCTEKIQSSPDSLPPGWIKEIKLRKNEQGVVYRKDPYYIDPATGYVFRSKVEVFRYLKTGVLGKHVRKPDQRNVSSMQSRDDAISFPIAVKRQKHVVAKQRLFSGGMSASDGQIANGASRSCSVSHGSTGCLTRRQSERIQAARLLKKELLELEDGNQPSDLLEQQILRKQSLELEDGDQPSNLLEQQLLRKQSLELEDGSQPLEGQLLKKQPLEFQDGYQPSDSLQDQSQSAPLENRHYHEAGLPLKLKDKRPLEGVVAMESDNRKLEGNGWLSGSDGELSKDVGPSEGKKQRENQLPFESVHSNPPKHGSSSRSQDKLLEHNLLFESVGEKVSDMDQMLKGLFHDSEEENQLDTVKKEADKESALVDQSLNAKSSLLESENNKQLHDKMARPKAKSTNIRSHKRKAEKTSVLPRRASKRLAGLEADPTLNFENPDHACRQAAKRQAVGVHPASVAVEECEQGMANDGKPVMIELKRAAIIEQDGSATPSSTTTKERPPGQANDEEPVVVEAVKTSTVETEKPSADKAEKSMDTLETEKLSADKAEKSMDNDEPQSLVPPFGDSWPDPCLEFAFKTLTGEISMDTLVIGDYFQQQLGGNQFSKPSL